MAEDLYKCSYCSKAYKVKRCVIAHMKKEHIVEWAAGEKRDEHEWLENEDWLEKW